MMAMSDSDINNNIIVTVILATAGALLLTSNTIIFIIGCVCGHCISQRRKKRAIGDNQPTPIYENYQLKTIRAEEQELELEMNKAYGHFQSENLAGNK